MNKSKDLSIESLRGLAILLMVSGHVIGHDAEAGLQVTEFSFYRYFYYSFEFFRMPLFTVISGYIYSLRPISNDAIFSFLKGKSRRLLIPLITVGTFHFMVKYLVPETNQTVYLNDIWKVYIFSFEHFWFLQALFLVFITMVVLEYYKLMYSFKGWLISFFSSIILFVLFSDVTNVFSFGKFLYLLPYFILGVGLYRHKNVMYHKTLIKLYLLILTLGMILIQLSWHQSLEFINPGLISLIILFAGFVGNILIFRFRFTVKPLASLGYYAFGIYLFHVFGTAGSRIILQHLGIESNFVLFIFGLIFGLTLPIILENFSSRFILLRGFFFGQRFYKRREKEYSFKHVH